MTPRNHTLLATEVALFLLTAAAIVGMHRLFLDGTYRSPLIVQAIAAHVVVALLRRRGVPLPLAAVATAAAAALMLSWTHYLDHTAWLLPTPETFRAAGDDIQAAWRLFKHVDAPAPVETGFLIASGMSVWASVFVADWAAFRAAAAFEALLPSGTLFVFAAAMGAPGGRVLGAALYATAAMLFVLLHRTLAQEERTSWAASHRSRGRWSLLTTGTALIGVAVVAGTVTGPNIPGARAEPILSWRDFGDDETRVVVSPMVDIQTRLVDQPEVELFTVRSPQPAYWRLTSLDEFDGRIWRSGYGTDDADGELPRAIEPTDPVQPVSQTFTISRLAAVWLPAAYEPRAIDPGHNEVDWDEQSSTLIVDKRVESSDGLTYEVSSAVPRWSAEQLSRAPDTVPDAIAERYLQLPELDPRVAALAEDLTAGIRSPYERALALQNHLRTSFTYNLDVPRGHSSDALVTFLFETREGYCEQFAGSFAALARTIGLPSRVAVGFTPGVPDPRDPSLYHVSGRHAHAWAEVYIADHGWVTFDPTPTRAPPRADEWLGVPAEQTTPEGAGNGSAPITEPAPAPGQQPQGGPLRAEQLEIDQGAGDLAATRDEGDDGALSLPGAVRSAARVVALMALAYLVLTPLANLVHGILRRRRATAPSDRVRLAWGLATSRAVEAGTELPPWLTVSEAATRLATAVPPAAGAVRQVAASMERVLYAEVEPSAEEAEGASEASATIVGEVRRREPLLRRMGRYFDIRRLWRNRVRAIRRTATSATSD